MGTAIQLPSGLDLSATATGYSLAAGASQTFINFFDAENLLTRNLGGTGGISTVAGTPTVSGPWTTLSNAATITTSVQKPSGDFTWFFVGELPALAQTSYFMGNLGASSGISVFHASGTTSRIVVGARIGGGSYVSFQTATSAVAANTPFCLVVRYDQSTTTCDVECLTSGISASDTFASDLVATSVPIMFGGRPTGETSAAHNIAAAVCLDSDVINDDVALIYAQLQAAMSAVGVTI